MNQGFLVRFSIVFSLLAIFAGHALAEESKPFRPASVPICAVDPYFIIWSLSDRLTDMETEHWTGRKHPLHMMVRIDGSPYRLMGAEPAHVPAMMQKSLEVGPLTTKYVFENETAEITLRFITPFIPSNLDLMSRPTTYILLAFESVDGRNHDLEFYFDAGAEIAVDTTNQAVNRSQYSKNDWIIWTATMTKNEADFHEFIDPVVAYVNDTPQRVPLSDWYFTDSARQRGFKARSAVGGFWAPMLKDTKKWQAQAAKGADIEGEWAEILLPGKPIKIIAPTAETKKLNWRYTMRQPGEGWEKADFDDSGWREGPAGFGTRDTPSVVIGTEWNSSDIWIRRSFEWDGELPENGTPVLNMHHDDDAEVYLNGKKILTRTGWTTSYQVMNSPELKDALKKGKNVLAIHCFQDHGGQYIDAGIEVIEIRKRK